MNPQGLLLDHGGVFESSVSAVVADVLVADGVPVGAVHDLVRGWVRRPEQPGVRAVLEAEVTEALAALGAPVPGPGLLERVDRALRAEPGVVGLAARARERGVRTALLSNAPGHWSERLGLDALLDVVAVSGVTGVAKPQPAAYLRVAAQLGVDPARCVVVDDLRANVLGAARAGMTGVHHTDLATTAAELAVLLELHPGPGREPGVPGSGA